MAEGIAVQSPPTPDITVRVIGVRRPFGEFRDNDEASGEASVRGVPRVSPVWPGDDVPAPTESGGSDADGRGKLHDVSLVRPDLHSSHRLGVPGSVRRPPPRSGYGRVPDVSGRAPSVRTPLGLLPANVVSVDGGGGFAAALPCKSAAAPPVGWGARVAPSCTASDSPRRGSGSAGTQWTSARSSWSPQRGTSSDASRSCVGTTSPDDAVWDPTLANPSSHGGRVAGAHPLAPTPRTKHVSILETRATQTVMSPPRPSARQADASLVTPCHSSNTMRSPSSVYTRCPSDAQERHLHHQHPRHASISSSSIRSVPRGAPVALGAVGLVGLPNALHGTHAWADSAHAVASWRDGVPRVRPPPTALDGSAEAAGVPSRWFSLPSAACDGSSPQTATAVPSPASRAPSPSLWAWERDAAATATATPAAAVSYEVLPASDHAPASTSAASPASVSKSPSPPPRVHSSDFPVEGLPQHTAVAPHPFSLAALRQRVGKGAPGATDRPAGAGGGRSASSTRCVDGAWGRGKLERSAEPEWDSKRGSARSATDMAMWAGISQSAAVRCESASVRGDVGGRAHLVGGGGGSSSGVVCRGGGCFPPGTHFVTDRSTSSRGGWPRCFLTIASTSPSGRCTFLQLDDRRYTTADLRRGVADGTLMHGGVLDADQMAYWAAQWWAQECRAEQAMRRQRAHLL